MASLDHRLNPLFSIKECMSCGALYTRNYGCSKGSLEDKILVPCLNEGWYTIHDENEILNTSESSNDNTNIVSAPQELFVFNQDPGENSSQSPLHIDHNCCYECGDLLDGIFCQQCTCKSCGKGTHYGYNCPPQIPIISNPEPCYNQNLMNPTKFSQSLQQQCRVVCCRVWFLVLLRGYRPATSTLRSEICSRLPSRGCRYVTCEESVDRRRGRVIGRSRGRYFFEGYHLFQPPTHPNDSSEICKSSHSTPQYETYSFVNFVEGNSLVYSDCQTGNTPVFDQGHCYNQDFGFNQPPTSYPNGLDIEMRKKERVLREEKYLAVSQRIKSICNDEDDSIPLRDIIA
ncbi:hypothetical protein Tco_1098921 [Tanacetum coccineum]